MRALMLAVSAIGLVSSPAIGQLVYTFTTATGNASASASVPGGTPAMVDESYDFSFQESVTFRREYPIGSQSSEGRALATPLSQLTLNRGAGGIICFLHAGAVVSSTHPQGMAEASSVGDLRFDFQTTFPVAWSLRFNLSTFTPNPGMMAASLTFGRVGETPLIDALITEPNQLMRDESVVTLLPGTYSMRAHVETFAEVAGVLPGGNDANAGVSFLFIPVPGPSGAGLLLGAAAWGTRRRRLTARG